jgi:superfamily I DNA/RNA helicase
MSEGRVLLGPPGTGKTTTLLNRIEALMQSGVAPDEIAFVSFTKAACNEARERACARFNLDEEDLPYFRTIHSMAFKFAMTRGIEVMSDRHWKDFGESCRYSFSENHHSETPFFASFVSEGDQMRQIYDLSRLCRCSLEDAMLRIGMREVRVTPAHVYAYVERLKAFKAAHNLVDFTDMLEMALRVPRRPYVRHAFVDEAQDLMPIQHALVEHWFFRSDTCEETTLAGDDDQAIFTWAGADPDCLIAAARKYRTEQLTQSWRIPGLVHSLATAIISSNKNRIAKLYAPRPDRGAILHCRSTEEAIGDVDGTHMALVRNIGLAEQFFEAAMGRGEYFSSEVGRKAPLDLAGVRGAYMALATLRANGAALPGHFADLLDQVPSRVDGAQLLPHGVKAKAGANERPVTVARARDEFGLGQWLEPILKGERPFDALLRLPQESRHYINRVYARHGVSLPLTPRFTITTMHRSKGREADVVTICPDMARASHREFERGDRESEHRTAYVAATRCKRELRIVQAKTERAFPYSELARAANA